MTLLAPVTEMPPTAPSWPTKRLLEPLSSSVPFEWMFPTTRAASPDQSRDCDAKMAKPPAGGWISGARSGWEDDVSL